MKHASAALWGAWFFGAFLIAGANACSSSSSSGDVGGDAGDSADGRVDGGGGRRGGGGGGGGGGDAGGAAKPYTGQITVVQRSSGGVVQSTEAIGAFYKTPNETGGGCAPTTSGACTLYKSCIAGGDVASFSGASAPAPADITLTAPPNVGTSSSPALSIDQATDLAVTWTGASGSNVELSLATAGATVSCIFDGGSGAGTVPSSLLAQLTSGATGAFLIAPYAQTTIAGSDVTTSVILEGTGLSGTLTTH